MVNLFQVQDYALALERRDEMRELLGDRAERLAYWNCAMDRASLEATLKRADGPFWIIDRLTQQRVELTREDYDDLWRVFLCDFLEQVARDAGAAVLRAQVRQHVVQGVRDRREPRFRGRALAVGHPRRKLSLIHI